MARLEKVAEVAEKLAEELAEKLAEATQGNLGAQVAEKLAEATNAITQYKSDRDAALVLIRTVRKTKEGKKKSPS